MTARRRLARLAPVAAAAVVLLSACGGDDSASIANPTTDTVTTADTFPRTDTTTMADVVSSDVVGGDDTAVFLDSSSPSDTVRADTEEVSDPVTLLKTAPGFLVPAGTAERREVALSGDVAAWVERDTPGAAPRLVTWTLTNVDEPPRPYFVPNLLAPRELVLDGSTLVYVDTRFGDADLFALDLASGEERALVTRPGSQTHPTLAGRRVAWEDCRRCVTGDAGDGADIFLLDLDAAADPINLTDDDRADRRPVFGTLADGGLALAWVHAGVTLRVQGLDDATDVAWVQSSQTEGAALVGGVLAWRPSPVIINPDSMMPSDVQLTMVADGATFPATFHGERLGVLDAVPRGAAGRFAFLGSPPEAPDVTRLRVVLGDGAAVQQVDVDGIATSYALGASWVAVTAPRADNGGFDDVWVSAIAP